MKKAIQIAYNDLFKLKCQYAAEAGFRYVSVNYSEILGKTEYEWETITEDIQHILEKNKLKCIQSHLHCYNLLESSEIPDENMDFAIRQSIISSGKLGVEYCAFHLRTSISSGYQISRSYEDNREILSGLLECAIKYGTSIAVENLPIFIVDEKFMPCYSFNLEDLATLVDSFHDKHMVICWDFGHANLINWDQATAIDFLGSRIKCTHVHNNFGRRDLHLTPDNGNIEWEHIMPALAETGFDGPLTLETHCHYDDFDLLRNFVKYNYACLEFLEKLAKVK